jgi:hypothetical protein
VALVPAMIFAKSEAEFPTSSFMLVAACSRDWLAGLFVTKLATVRACRTVELIGRCNATGRASDLQKVSEVLLKAGLRVNWRKTVFMTARQEQGLKLILISA